MFLNEWKRSSLYTENRIRERIRLDNNNDLDETDCILIRWFPREQQWKIEFRGSLVCLTDIWSDMRPGEGLHFARDVEEVQEHIDKFIHQFNSLKAFL